MCTYEAVLKMGSFILRHFKSKTFSESSFFMEENRELVRPLKTEEMAFLTPFSTRVSKVVYTPEKNVHVQSGFENGVVYSPGF